MEFKFRAIDHRLPSSQLPTISPFSDHSFRAGFSSAFPLLNTDQMATPNGAVEELRRELEKERIRREIISGEIVRRRLLEEEVRRELIAERELAMRLFNPRLQLMMHAYDNRPLEERIAFPRRRELSLSTMPLLPQLMTPETEPAPETNKDKLIMLTKQDPNLNGAKWKSVTPPAVDGGEHFPFGLKKKPKEDWSCALCQVSTTSEKALNAHLQGRKHKAKVAALRMPKIGKSASTSFSSKKSEKSVNPTETIVTSTSGLDAKADVVDEDKLEIKNEESLVHKNQNRNSKKRSGIATEQVGKTNAVKRKRKFKFWCELCQVGTGSIISMESHKKGKKHIKRMEKLCQNDGSAPSTTTVVSETTPLTKYTHASDIETKLMTSFLSKETNMKTASGFPNSSQLSLVPESGGDRVSEVL